MLNIEELKDIIVYITYRCSFPHLPEYSIQKLIFLAEIECYRSTGKRLTQVDYKSYDYGPFSQNVRDALNALKAEEDRRVRFGPHCNISRRVYEGVSAALPGIEVPNIPKEKFEILERVCSKWGEKTPTQMVEHIERTYIYATTPYDRYYEFEKIPPKLIDKTIEEDEVVDGEALKDEEIEFLPLARIRPPKMNA